MNNCTKMVMLFIFSANHNGAVRFYLMIDLKFVNKNSL